MFQTDYHSKNKKVPQRLSIGAKYSGQIIAAKMFRTDFLSEQQILRMESYTQNSYAFTSRETCH
jgi:hypothetical protein